MTEFVFLLMVTLTLGGALAAVLFKQVFYNALGLGMAFFGIAGLYIFLAAPFLAAIQIIVYIGAVAVAIVFAVMLSDPENKPVARDKKRLLLTLPLCGIAFILLSTLVVKFQWQTNGSERIFTVEDIGHTLLTRYVLSFELISAVLLVAILGALVISRKTDQ